MIKETSKRMTYLGACQTPVMELSFESQPSWSFHSNPSRHGAFIRIPSVMEVSFESQPAFTCSKLTIKTLEQGVELDQYLHRSYCQAKLK